MRATSFLSLLLVFAMVACEEEIPIVVTGGTKPGGSETIEKPEDKPGDEPGDKPGDEPGGETDDATVPPSVAGAVNYSDLFDPLSDAGQFYLPDNGLNPSYCWTLVYGGTGYGPREEPLTSKPTTTSDLNSGLQGYLLMQSVAGLVNRACEQGKTKIGIWIEQGGKGYVDERNVLPMEIGRQTAYELVSKEYSEWNGKNVTVKDLFEGYVLTDVVNNPESANVAAVASHVYNSIIVDVLTESYFKDLGYTKKYDATKKTLSDAFTEFKDKCDNSCLVLMPVKTGEHRDYVIKNGLFIVNLNKAYASGKCENMSLYKNVLNWLKPCSQVLGWEQGVGEDTFVGPASEYGHMVLAADWSYNLAMTSHNYRKRQPSIKVKTINPREIDYDKKAHYCSFFLTDGDNYQFIITDNFVNNYYGLSSAATTKSAFEIGTQSLIQLAPTRFRYLVQIQPSPECTIMETFGGGYYYLDKFSTASSKLSNRSANLKTVASRTAAHMRQHGIKVLHVMVEDITSTRTKEGLQAFVDANDQLEGITVVQYNPYNGGGGKIIWLKNKSGYDIPCISTKYMTWDGLASPSDVASSMRNKETAQPSHCTCVMHCWSTFNGQKSTDVATQVISYLPDSFEAVSMQELIWRVRMAERRDQTRQYLSTIK